MRQATPWPTALSAPDQRLKPTPTLPGWMMVNEAHPAATMKKTMASTTPLASAAGPGARISSGMTILPREGAVAAPFEHDDAGATGLGPEPAGEPCLEPWPERYPDPHHPAFSAAAGGKPTGAASARRRGRGAPRRSDRTRSAARQNSAGRERGDGCSGTVRRG